MARNKTSPQPSVAASAASAAGAAGAAGPAGLTRTTSRGFWGTRLRPFLTRQSNVLACILVAIGIVRIAATYPFLYVTADEPTHFACGLTYLAEHNLRYETEHPPLAPMMAAALPYLDGLRPIGVPDPYRETELVAVGSGNPMRVLTLARMGILPFFVLACLVVYLWSRHHFGRAVAMIATGLFTLLPPVLAHAGLATTDMALTACLGAAFYALVLWAESPTWKRTLLLAVTAALAALAKFTSLLYLPAAAALALAACLATAKLRKPALLRLFNERAARFGVAVLAGLLVAWAGYGFSFGQVSAWNVSLPAPEFFNGVFTVADHNKAGHAAYLLGSYSQTGWWYYFPVVLGVKTPLALLLLTGIGAYICFTNRAQCRYWLPAAFSLGVLVPAMLGHINIGVRHVLPVYLGFSIMAALAVVRLAKWRASAGVVAGLLVIWMAVSGAINHPDYIAYFNELAPAEREKVLVDSDLDWGQDVLLLARRLRELGVHEISLGQGAIITDETMAWCGLPPIKPVNPTVPAEGWTVISPTLDKTSQYGLYHRDPNAKTWYEQLKPKERVGALLLYYVPPAVPKNVQNGQK